MTKQILIGCDPELFVQNPNSGAYVSGHDMIQGTKEDPFKVKDGMVQVDGTALEFGIDPAATMDEFVSRIQSVTGQLREMVPGYNLVAHPTATFEPAYFKELPRYAKMLGCTPDFNAWTGNQNDPPQGNRPFRTGAGHIHIGWTSGEALTGSHYETCRAVARQMDYFLGVWSLLWDKDGQRRMMYGKAGAFRPKPYGVEYRTLSNAWTADERLMRWVFLAAKKGTEELLFSNNDYSNNYGDVARNIIDNDSYDWQNWTDIDIKMPSPPKVA